MYRATEIPYPIEPSERLFMIRNDDNPNSRERPVLITFFDNQDQEHQGVIGLRLFGLGLDLDHDQLIDHVLDTLNKGAKRYE